MSYRADTFLRRRSILIRGLAAAPTSAPIGTRVESVRLLLVFTFTVANIVLSDTEESEIVYEIAE